MKQMRVLMITLAGVAATAAAASAQDGLPPVVFDPVIPEPTSDWDNLFKELKNGESLRTNVGGEFRLRFHDENNHRHTTRIANQLGLTGGDDEFVLYRSRLWFDNTFNDTDRVYVELLDAVSTRENLAPQPIDENRLDLYQVFFDMAITDLWNVRIGRQGVALGTERMVSTLEWANTRRALDGVTLHRSSEEFDLDVFWYQPLSISVKGADKTNHEADLYGVYLSGMSVNNRKFDCYWISLDNDVAATRYDTLAALVTGEGGCWQYELEGGVQLGKNVDNSRHVAGFTTIGLGRDVAHRVGGALWLYYDWASGDDSVGGGFHHYLPLAHKYLGFMDLFGRSNLHDVNIRWTRKLTEKLSVMVWYHDFALANANDVPYNVNMTPFNGMSSGSSGSRDLGQEIDLTASLELNNKMNLLLGYSHFFSGDYYFLTSGLPHSDDASFFYTQFTMNF